MLDFYLKVLTRVHREKQLDVAKIKKKGGAKESGGNSAPSTTTTNNNRNNSNSNSDNNENCDNDTLTTAAAQDAVGASASPGEEGESDGEERDVIPDSRIETELGSTESVTVVKRYYCGHCDIFTHSKEKLRAHFHSKHAQDTSLLLGGSCRSSVNTNIDNEK